MGESWLKRNKRDSQFIQNRVGLKLIKVYFYIKEFLDFLRILFMHQRKKQHPIQKRSSFIWWKNIREITLTELCDINREINAI